MYILIIIIIIILSCYVKVTQKKKKKCIRTLHYETQRKLAKLKLSSKEKEKGPANKQSNLNDKFLQFLLTQLKSPIIYILRFIIFRTEDFFFFFYLGKREKK